MHEQRDRDGDDRAGAGARWRSRRPRAVGCSTITVQPSGAIRAATPSCRRPSSSMYSCDTGVVAPRARAAANSGWRAHVARLRDERLLVGIAVRDQLAVGRDDQREAVVADADLIDHPPHFLEAELADEPAGGLVQVRQRGWRRPTSAAGLRRRGSATSTRRRSSSCASFGIADARLADAARRDHRAVLVEQRDLAELAELEHVVLENLILLALAEAGVLQVGGERLEQLGVGDDVAADFLGGAGRDVLVAVDDRVAGAALQREDRDRRRRRAAAPRRRRRAAARSRVAMCRIVNVMPFLVAAGVCLAEEAGFQSRRVAEHVPAGVPCRERQTAC